MVPETPPQSIANLIRLPRGRNRELTPQMTHHRPFVVVALATLISFAAACRATPEAPAPGIAADRDLLDVTVPQLQRLYADKQYTVTQVVQWHLDRIDRYNGVYGGCVPSPVEKQNGVTSC